MSCLRAALTRRRSLRSSGRFSRESYARLRSLLTLSPRDLHGPAAVELRGGLGILTYEKVYYDLDNQIKVSPMRRDQGMRFIPYIKNNPWHQEAPCGGASELFEPSYPQGYDKARVVKMNERKFEKGRELCGSCPVWHLCYSNSSEDDFFYTMRAGIEPAQFTDYKEENARVRYRSRQKSQDAISCKRGHKDWIVYPSRGRRICRSCDKMTPDQKKEFDVLNATMGV